MKTRYVDDDRCSALFRPPKGVKDTLRAIHQLHTSTWRLATIFWVMAFPATSGAGAAEAIPVRMIDGLPVVEVQLGAIKADFLLDTGGQLAITVPPPLLNTATGVSLGTEQRKMGDAAGNVFTVQSLVATRVRHQPP